MGVRLKVLKELGYGLDEKAVEALYWWRFSPALRNGIPVSAVAEIEVPFRFAVKRIEITADSQVVLDGVTHFKGKVEIRVSRSDGTFDLLKANEVTYRADRFGDARVSIRNAQ